MPKRVRSQLAGLTLADLQEAAMELRRLLQPTPLLRNAWFSEAFGCELYLKLENMQPIGSFKIRGATHRISRLSAAERRRGVIAASAGNHAQGVAWGSQQYGVRATIVMPRGASLMKIQNTRTLGAEVVLAGDSYDEAYEEARKIALKTGKVYIHAFEDKHVIAGQGTVGLEIMEQLPEADCVIGSVGGGGLMSGTAIAVKELRPQCEIVACQATGASSMARSVKRGRAIEAPRTDTFADGIAVRRASPGMMRLLSPLIDRWVTADDERIAAAVLQLMEKAKVIAEGSGAVPLAAAEKMGKVLKGKRVVLIVSGGNIDVNVVSRIIDLGLVNTGRRLRVNVLLQDRPGSLARLAELIAGQGANVLQAIHDRSEPGTSIDETEVALTLETRGPEHSAALIAALRAHVLKLDLVRA